ncbi:MAG: response regulator transcription factor [Bacteroidota bacterium]
MGSSSHLLVADDYAPIRQGLVLMLNPVPEFQLVGEASNGQQVIDQLPLLEVDVVLMDVEMPIMDGIATTKYIRQHFSNVKVLGMSPYDEPCYRQEMIEAGALGCISKTSATSTWIEALKAVSSGKHYIS